MKSHIRSLVVVTVLFVAGYAIAQQAVGGVERVGQFALSNPVVVGGIDLDGGVARLRVSSSGSATVVLGGISDAGGALPVHEQGYTVTGATCVEGVCTSAGDGGCLALTTGTRYSLTNTSEADIRVRNGAPPVSFACAPGTCPGISVDAGTGNHHTQARIIPAGAVLDESAKAAPDGGSPLFCCIAKSSSTILQACPLQ
jgi:hypothetical protein